MNIENKYKKWLEYAIELKADLQVMNKNEIEDAFYRDLEFGTGGLRGVIGAGTNRMNVYTVAQASQGLANYVKKNGGERIAVSFDSRIKSEFFAQIASGVFIANGIKVSIYKELMPTPCLSYAVREYNCVAGIMITASHNPAKYNGYKVYGSDGCQITTEAATSIQEEIGKIDVFSDVKRMEFDEVMKSGLFEYFSDYVYTDFIGEVKNQSVLFGDEIDKNVSIIYSPLNGAGLKPVLRVLKESGYTNVTVVAEQEQPDGHFPTCPFPNPEIKEAMSLGIEYAEKYNADLLLATDPDCDRVGIAVKEGEEYTLISGNEVGLLLLDYICSQRVKHSRMPIDPVLIKTIVTTDLAEVIAKHYGVKTINVLTGFKFIGEQIGLLEKQGKETSYIFGFEESYGYLSGSYVRDKDAVDGTFLICEMFAYYKTQGESLVEKLEDIYRTYGYCLNTLNSFEFDGSAGFDKMQKLMGEFRKAESIGEFHIQQRFDYLSGIDGLPKSDVLKFLLPCGSIVVRPSGTEPKLKVYISVTAENKYLAQKTEEKIEKVITSLMV